MTAPEYIQMRAFARMDGLWLAGLWLASFVCYVAGLRTPGLSLIAMVLALTTPFLCYRLTCRYRDGGLDGILSFGRGWVYVVFLFLYGGLLFAIAQFVYFTWMDNGYFVSALDDMFHAPESAEAMRQMDMGSVIDDAISQLKTMRPIDLVLNILTSNLIIGCLLALPIAATAKRSKE